MMQLDLAMTEMYQPRAREGVYEGGSEMRKNVLHW